MMMNEAYLTSSWASACQRLLARGELQVNQVQNHRRRQRADHNCLVAILVPEMFGRERQHGDAQQQEDERG